MAVHNTQQRSFKVFGKTNKGERSQYPGLDIRQLHLRTFPNKPMAHAYETSLVVAYIAVHGERPPEQGLPKGGIK